MSDIVERLRKATLYEGHGELSDLPETAAAVIEKERIENVQMRAALGYPIRAELERHIIPSNPFNCGTCGPKADEITRLRNELHIAQEWSSRVIAGREEDNREITALRAENERLRSALREYECHCPTSECEWFPCGRTARAALEEKP